MNDDKTHISKFGKVFEYLKDPALRQKEKGDAVMEFKGALISGEAFKGMEWKNIRFIECDFTGAYEIKLAGLSNCLFEGCRFAGIFNFGLLQAVRFNNAVVRGETVLNAGKGSKEVLFENSDFRSLSDNTNHWGSINMHGEAKYVNCYAKWFDIAGDEKLTIERSRIVDCSVGKGDIGCTSIVTITDTEFLGKTDMVSSYMSSLTMRNCTVGVLELNRSHVSGEVVLENVEAEQLNLGFYTAGKVTLRNCKCKPTEFNKFSLNTAVDSIDQFLADNCTFGRLPVAIGPGVEMREDQWSATPQNKLVRFSRCTMESLDATWTESQNLRIELCTISSADFSHSRIGSLQIEASTISQKLDLSNTRITKYSIKDLEPSKYRKVLLEGSSIKQFDT